MDNVDKLVDALDVLLKKIVLDKDNIDPSSIDIGMNNDVKKVDGDKPYQEYELVGSSWYIKWKYKKAKRF